jgi:hypothetical protein
MLIQFLSISTPACPADDVLFELLKAGFNFLSIILDDPYHGKLRPVLNITAPSFFRTLDRPDPGV